MNILSNAPIREPYAGADGSITRPWLQWFFELAARLNATANVQKTVAKTAQAAAIVTSNVPLGSISAGQYRFSYYARVTTPATVNSSLTVTLGWTDGSVAQSASGAAMTGNTTTTAQSGTLLATIDKNSPLTYATAYVTNGATAMQYKLTVVVEAVS